MATQDTNRSFVLRAVQDVVLEDRAIPTLKDPWDVRVHVAQTGICGSDVHYWQRGRIGGKTGYMNIPLGLGTYFRFRFHTKLAHCPRT